MERRLHVLEGGVGEEVGRCVPRMGFVEEAIADRRAIAVNRATIETLREAADELRRQGFRLYPGALDSIARAFDAADPVDQVEREGQWAWPTTVADATTTEGSTMTETAIATDAPQTIEEAAAKPTAIITQTEAAVLMAARRVLRDIEKRVTVEALPAFPAGYDTPFTREQARDGVSFGRLAGIAGAAEHAVFSTLNCAAAYTGCDVSRKALEDALRS